MEVGESIIEATRLALANDDVWLAEEILLLAGYRVVFSDDRSAWLVVEAERVKPTRAQAIRDHVSGLLGHVPAGNEKQAAEPNHIGRPRDLEKEAIARDPLAQGVPVGKVAIQVGLHRNTVTKIATRSPTPLTPDQKKFGTMKLRKPEASREGGVGKFETYRNDAVKYLEKHGPTRQTTVARECGIPLGSSTAVFRCDRFHVDSAGMLTIAEPPAAAPNWGCTVTKPPARQREKPIDAAARLLKKDQPLTLFELSKETGVPQAELFRLLADETKFEKSEAGYWLV